MTGLKRLTLFAALCAVPAILSGQTTGLNQTRLLKPLADEWTSYSGDYSGKRFSTLTQINTANVKNLSLAWVGRVAGGIAGRAGAPPTIVGGVGTGEYGITNIRGSVLMVDGVLYATAPDNVWALDARDGHVESGTTSGRRAARPISVIAVWGCMATGCRNPGQLPGQPGGEDWQGAVAQGNLELRAAVILDGRAARDQEPRDGGHEQRPRRAGLPAMSRNPITGDLQWRWYTVPMKEGDPRPARDVERP